MLVFSNWYSHFFRNGNFQNDDFVSLSSLLVSFLCPCPQTYSQLAHPIQQARGLGLLFQSKILDIDNIDVSI